MPDYPDWFGTPLVHGVSFPAGQVSPLVVPAGGTQTFTLLMSHPGYFIDILGTISAAATIPFYQVEFVWQDFAATTTIDVEHFVLAASSTGPWRVCGKGPNRGQLLKVKFTNYDPAQALTVTYSIGETTQHVARDDWRSVDYATANVPTYGIFGDTPSGLAFGDLASNVLMADGNNTLPANTLWTRLMPLYCGQLLCQFLANANISVSLRTPAALPNSANFGGGVPIWIDGTLTNVTVTLGAPRCPMVLFLQNSTGAGISGVGSMLIPIEYAS